MRQYVFGDAIQWTIAQSAADHESRLSTIINTSWIARPAVVSNSISVYRRRCLCFAESTQRDPVPRSYFINVYAVCLSLFAVAQTANSSKSSEYNVNFILIARTIALVLLKPSSLVLVEHRMCTRSVQHICSLSVFFFSFHFFYYSLAVSFLDAKQLFYVYDYAIMRGEWIFAAMFACVWVWVSGMLVKYKQKNDTIASQWKQARRIARDASLTHTHTSYRSPCVEASKLAYQKTRNRTQPPSIPSYSSISVES